MKLHVSFPKIIFICILLLTSGKISIAQNNLRPIDQLTADSSGFDIVRNAMRIARNKYEILPAELAKAKDALYQTQVTTRSPMGAIIYFTGGILIDGGWIRILGSGNDKLDRSLAQWNKGKTFNELAEKPKFLLIRIYGPRKEKILKLTQEKLYLSRNCMILKLLHLVKSKNKSAFSR